jgi:hypothetical protein
MTCLGHFIGKGAKQAHLTFWRFFTSKSAEPTADMNIFLDNWTFSAITWGAFRLSMPPM